MSSIIDIKIWELALAFIMLVIPIVFFQIYRINIKKDVLISIARMVVQLSLVAIYMEWIFAVNNAWINAIWVFIMISVGIFTTIRRVAINWRFFVIPLFIAGLTSVVIIDAFFIGIVLKPDYFFDTRYFIPITGMVLGNALSHNIIGLTSYFKGLSEKSDLYLFLLTNTGNPKLALRPFIGEAVKDGLNPLIASISVIGLIALPGMMTGQLLGGSPPSVAIKYQIMIMLAIFVGCSINLFLSIIFSNFFVFDGYGKLKTNILKSNK
jgi:putative ABC transport system permease protein